MHNRLWISCLSAAISSVALFTPAVNAASQNETVLNYTFDQIDGQTLTDASSHGHTGTLHGIGTDDLAPGREGNALRFNGISSYVVIDKANDLAFEQHDFTLSLWFKPTKAEGTLLSMASNRTSSFGRYQILLTQGKIRVIWAPAETSDYQSILSNAPLVLDQWTQLVVVFDRSSKKVSLYLNGSLDQTGEWTGGTRGSADQGFYLGAHAVSQVEPSFVGLMDNLKIINTAMKPQTIQAQWQQSLRADQAKSPWAGSDVMGYVVPATSSTRWLANVIPDPSTISNTISMTAAKGEFESASFILYPLADINKLAINVSDLKGKKTGKSIASSQVDLRIVKRWYQSGNAWDGYPLQNLSHRVLVPELLLHDEEMVRVDHKTQDNYLRLDQDTGPEYISISYKSAEDYKKKPVSIPGHNGVGFNYGIEPVNDAKTLQPVTMHIGQTKQFWVTLHVPADAAADHYTGTLDLTAGGKKLGSITIELRVLPYELPMPRTYYNLDRSYYLTTYNAVNYTTEFALTQSDERAIQRMKVMYENMANHGAYEPKSMYLYQGFTEKDAQKFVMQLKLQHEAGLANRMVIVGDAGPYQWWVKSKDEAEAQKRMKDSQDRIDATLRLVKEATGLDADKVYFYGIDEAHGEMLTVQLPTWKYIQSKGANIFTSGWLENIRTTAFSENFHTQAGKPDPESAAQWHALGNRISTYAYPFSGPEDPQLWRRNVGMLTYKANYDGFSPYIYFEAGASVWNDFLPAQYRGLNLVYPVKDGVIDTIAWEGFREGVDDVRYATLMKQLAAKAIASSSIDARHVGKRALQWLALLDSETADLGTTRLEMINHIDQIRQALGEGE